MDNPKAEEIESVNGFRLSGYKGVYEFVCESKEELSNWMKHLRRVCVVTNISHFYSFGKLLGKGNFAKVHIGTRKADNAIFAIKTIAKTKILETPRNIKSVYNEITALRKIDHPNIIKLFEVYENEMFIHLVIEYLKGGELFKRLQNKGAYSEKDASMAIKHVLEALNYCHKHNIVHRDLKPENLVLTYIHM